MTVPIGGCCRQLRRRGAGGVADYRVSRRRFRLVIANPATWLALSTLTASTGGGGTLSATPRLTIVPAALASAKIGLPGGRGVERSGRR